MLNLTAEQLAELPLYRHHATGFHYRLVGVTNDKATRDGWPVTAVYVDSLGTAYSRPKTEFDRKFERVP